jgi:hypothetical protein
MSQRAIRRPRVAADVSRRILSAAKMAPTDVGGYTGMKYPDWQGFRAQGFEPGKVGETKLITTN